MEIEISVEGFSFIDLEIVFATFATFAKNKLLLNSF